MPRTPARVTQADMARALRAAKAVGGVRVEVKPDGTIILAPVDPEQASQDKRRPARLDASERIIL